MFTAEELAKYSGSVNQDDGWSFGDTFRYPVATAIDLANTLVNSVAEIATLSYWDSESRSTSERLKALDEFTELGFSDFYEDNQTLVNVSSFVGGILIPGMAVSKGLKYAQSSQSILPNIFKSTQRAKLVNYRKAKESFKLYGETSEEYRLAMKAMSRAALKQGIGENLIQEAMFAAYMNQHAYMEDGYDPTDFAIGATLGTGFAFLNRIAVRRRLTDSLLPLQEKLNEVSKGAIPVNYTADSMGDEVTGLVLSYNSAVRTLAEGREGLNTQTLDEVTKHKARSLAKAKVRILDGMDTTLAGIDGKDYKKHGINGVAKKVIEEMRYPVEDIYEASPANILTRIEVEQTGALKGVGKFTAYNADDLIDDDLIKTTYLDQTRTGEATALNNQVAVESVAYDWQWDVARGTKGAPESFKGVEPRFINSGGQNTLLVEIPKNSMLKDKDFRQWFATRISEPEFDGVPVILRSQDGKLNGLSSAVTKNRLKSQVTELDQKISGIRGVTEGDFITPNDLLRWKVPDTDFAIVIPYFGHKIMNGTLGRITLPASADSGVMDTIQRRAIDFPRGTNKWNPLNESTQLTDGKYLQGAFIAKNDTKGTYLDKTIDMRNIHQLQTAVQIAGKTGGKIKIAGRVEPVDFTEGVNLLLAQKAKLASELLENGAAIEQVALKTNLSVETVEVMQAAGFKMTPDVVASLPEWAKYSRKDPEVIAKAPIIRLLGKHRTARKIEEAKQKATLDLDTLREVHKNIVRESIDLKQSESARSILENILDTDGWKEIESHIEVFMQTIEKNRRFFTDATQALRSQKELGDIVTHFGKRLQDVVNQQIKADAIALESSMRSVAQNPKAALQFEQVKRVVQNFTDEGSRLQVEGNKIRIIGGEKNGEFVKYLEGGEITLTSELKNMLEAYQPIQADLLRHANANRRMQNMPDIPDRGLWFPYEAVEDQFIAFKVNKTNPNDIYIITARSADELKAQLNEANRVGDNAQFDFVTRDQLGYWNDLLDTTSLNPLTRADSSYKKSGIALHAPRADAGGLDELMDDISATRWRNARRTLRTGGAEVFQKLERAKEMYDEAAKSTGTGLAQKLGRGTPTTEIVYKTLMNTTSMERFPVWQMANNGVTAKINQGMTMMKQLWESSGFSKTASVSDFTKWAEEAKDAGIPVPWQNVEEYLKARGQSKLTRHAEERIAQINGLSTFFNLRLLDAAHGIITTLSTPVILSGQMRNVGAPLKEFVKTSKWMFTEEGKAILKEARAKNLIISNVAETTEILTRMHTSSSKEYPAWLKKGMKYATYAADRSEEITREYAFAMGYRIAREKGIGSHQIRMSYADGFTTRAMGNYVARQRPVMFQGSIGSIIGLYQTFMITMGQNVYRYLENVDRRSLMYLMGAQSAMFGIESLPFYHPFNRMLGDHFSEDNENITTQVGEALSQDAQEFMLYGLPSYVFQAGLFTRAELQPRTPLSMQEGIGINPASLNNVVQGFSLLNDLLTNIGSSMKHDGSTGDWVHATAQSMAAQSIWRPGARAAEILMGRSYDRKGELIDEFDLASFGNIARIMASRPLKETILRSAKFNAGYYNASDKASRQKVIRQIRRVAATNEGLGESITPLMEEYLQEGGSAEGFRDIVKQAYSEASTTFGARLQKDIKHQEGYFEYIEDYK